MLFRSLVFLGYGELLLQSQLAVAEEHQSIQIGKTIMVASNDIQYPQGQTASALSVSYSYPLWICEKYILDFGYEFSQALLSYHAPHTTVIRVNTLKTDSNALEDELKRLGFQYERGSLPDAYAVGGLAQIESLDMYKKGWIAVQSESAMQIGRAHV